MPRPDTLYDWQRTLATILPDHHPAARDNLAAWSYALVCQKTFGLVTLAAFLAQYLGQKLNTVRQRLRELYQPAECKAGAARTTFDPATLTRPLLAWITRDWTDRRLPLALDASNLGARFTVLAASVVVRGTAVPVAWRVVAANQPGESWNDIWIALVARVRAALGPDWSVYVFTDRGLESPRLFRALATPGCHPVMRVKAGGHFRPAGWADFHPVGDFARHDGDRFAAAGVAYKGAGLPCTLVACRVAGCDDPWVLLTDLPPAAVDPRWYGFRGWIEELFRSAKRGRWGWQRTRMTDPARAERCWAVIAVASVWVVAVGCEEADAAEAAPRPESKSAPESKPSRPREANSPRRVRRVRVVLLGLTAITVGLLGGVLRVGRLTPEPWPTVQPIPSVSEADFGRQKDTYP